PTRPAPPPTSRSSTPPAASATPTWPPRRPRTSRARRAWTCWSPAATSREKIGGTMPSRARSRTRKPTQAPKVAKKVVKTVKRAVKKVARKPAPTPHQELERLLAARNEHPERLTDIDRQIWTTFGATCAVWVLDMCGFSRLTLRYGITHFLAM